MSVRAARPAMLEVLLDRPEDLLEPLLAIADPGWWCVARCCARDGAVAI